MSAHFRSGGFEFAYCGEDLCEPVSEAIKGLALVVVW
jgi:hypothetical protein